MTGTETKTQPLPQIDTNPLPQISTTAEDILSYLIAEHGVTALDPFERAYCLCTVKETLQILIEELSLAYIETIASLLDAERRTSDDNTYRLEEVTKYVTAVDKQKLLRNEPELYEKIARVSASTILKELGHSTLREQLIQKTGIEKVHLYDTINIKDFDAAYPDKTTAGEYRKASAHTIEYRVVKETGKSAGTPETEA